MGLVMKGFVDNIDKITEENNNFRKVLYTGRHSQLVVMSLKPKEDIGMEVHNDVDQFFRIEKGNGRAVIDGKKHVLRSGAAVIVPAGAKHNIVNTSKKRPLKLYTIYSPPEHKDKVLKKTKAEAMAKEEHFDGKTTE